MVPVQKDYHNLCKKRKRKVFRKSVKGLVGGTVETTKRSSKKTQTSGKEQRGRKRGGRGEKRIMKTEKVLSKSKKVTEQSI